MIEIDLPVLVVNVPDNLVIEKINLSSEILFEIIYSAKSADNTNINLSMIYQKNIVSTSQFFYTQFKLTIWNIY